MDERLKNLILYKLPITNAEREELFSSKWFLATVLILSVLGLLGFFARS